VLFIDLCLLFIYVHGVIRRGVNQRGGSLPVAVLVEAPVGAVTWRRHNCSSWALSALMGLLLCQCCWAPLFILVIKCIITTRNLEIYDVSRVTFKAEVIDLTYL
jgi:hypothetical protein